MSYSYCLLINLFNQITMRIEQSKTTPLSQIVVHQGFEQSRFAGSGFADDVNVRQAVSALDTEGVFLIAKGCLGKDLDCVSEKFVIGRIN